MKRKIFPVLIALILMIVIGGSAIGIWYKEKYSYGTEIMDLRTYFDIEEDRRAIFMQDERMAEKAIYQDGMCYLNLNFVKSYLNDGFYFDRDEKELLYTDALGTFEVSVGGTSYSKYGESVPFGGQVCFMKGEGLFVAMPYVALFTEYEYTVDEYRLRFVTNYDSYTEVPVTKDTKMRYQGDIKSEILCDVTAGEKLKFLEQLDSAWYKVENQNGIAGYVETKFLGDEETVLPSKREREREYTLPEYTAVQLGEKVCLGFHAIGGVGGNVTLEEMVSGAEGMNVIAPTWFSLNDNEGGFRNFGDASYVTRAHKYGLKVWGVFDDFNYENETGNNVDDTLIFSQKAIRRKLIDNIVKTAVSLGLDGINLDFEKLSSDGGEAFGQFLRELSAECRKKEICLSVDTYMPNDGNRQYHLDVQGLAVDYVILMGYDEHWHGSGKPGSVASLGFISDGIARALKDVPADKLVNAVPFYTILWKIDGTQVEDEYLTLVNEPGFISRIGREPVWDDVACQNYLEWTEGNRTYKIWFEDLDSISMKLNVMSANGLAGVAAWRLGYGTQEVWTLLGAYKLL